MVKNSFRNKSTFIFQMDSDCLVCLGKHHSGDCPERTSHHCPNCHVLIKHCSDHATTCAIKTWLYASYSGFYARVPTQRFIIGFDSPFRLLMNGTWPKALREWKCLPKTARCFVSFRFRQGLKHSVDLICTNSHNFCRERTRRRARIVFREAVVVHNIE